jgi:hypothetical protein
MRMLSTVGIVMVLAGCTKGSDAGATHDDAGHPPSSSSAASLAAPRDAGAAPTKGVDQKWTGKYTASAGSFSVPDGGEWAGVKFRGEDAGVGLGEGALSLSVDDSGHVRGDVEGPLGPLRLAGTLADGAFGAALVSGKPGEGFSGTAVGTESAERITGTMRLSLPTGNVLREASFSLEKQR